MEGFITKVQKYLVVNGKTAKEIVKESFHDTLVYYGIFLAVIAVLGALSAFSNQAVLGVFGGSTAAPIVGAVLSFIGMLVLAFVLAIVAQVMGKNVPFEKMFAALVFSNTLALVIQVILGALAVVPVVGPIVSALLGIVSLIASLVVIYFFYVVLTSGLNLSSGQAIVVVIASAIVTFFWMAAVGSVMLLLSLGQAANTFGPMMMQ